MEILEGVFIWIVFIVIVGGIFGGYQWIVGKFFGVRYYGGFQAKKAEQQSFQEESYLRQLSAQNPELVEQAIERCKKKHYKLTPPNILSEVSKIEKKYSSVPNSGEKLKQTVKSIASKLKSQKSITKIEKIEKLAVLKEQGVINQQEFEQLKKEII